MLGFVVCLFLAMPFALAEENDTNKTFEVKGGREYPLLERAIDRIKLAFTFQIERKQELIAKIEQRREEHYQFLLAKGKTDQAEAFKAKTIGLEKNFAQWKANKQEILGRIENKSAEVRNDSGKAMDNKPEAPVQKGRSY